LGEAKILGSSPPENRIKTYLRKYREGIRSLNMTIEEFAQTYSVPILITPRAIRGFL